MKKLHLFAFFLTAVMFFSCNDDSPTTTFPSCNDTRNPANDIGWIRQMIDDNQNLNDDAHIICYQLDGLLVFLVDLCVPCGDGFVVYDCEKKQVCADNQNGNNTCTYFTNNAINEIIIWKNY